MNSNKLPVGSYLAVGLSYNNTDEFDENALVYSCTPAGDNWSVYQGYGVGNGGPIQCDKRGIGLEYNTYIVILHVCTIHIHRSPNLEISIQEYIISISVTLHAVSKVYHF